MQKNNFLITMLYTTIAGIQRIGNRLPDPVVLFIYLCLSILALSALCSWLSLSAIHPVTQEMIVSKNLLSSEGLLQIISGAVKNFSAFAPVGVVLVVMLGIGIAEHSGLITAVVKRLLKKSQPWQLAYLISFAGVMSSLGADVGYVVLIPLAGLIYLRAKRPPLAGIAVAFASVSAGFSANLFLGPIDVLLAGLSTEAAQIVEPSAHISAASNYYFTLFSTLMITLICGWLSNHVIEPHFTQSQAVSHPQASHQSQDQINNLSGQVSKDSPSTIITTTATTKESKALLAVSGFSVIYLIALMAMTFLDGGPFYVESSKHSDSVMLLLKNIVPLLAFYFATAGYIYGRVSGVYQSLSNTVAGMQTAMQSMAYYLVLMFFAAQFVSYFNQSNLGFIFAIKGASWLQSLDLPTSLILLLMVFVSSSINLFIGSASAKWALLAPIFIPMLMLAGVAPEQTQMAYRIGDSCTNIITPLMPYFGIVLAYAQQYQSTLKIGDIIAAMLPYSVALLIIWTAIFIFWLNINLPLGINV